MPRLWTETIETHRREVRDAILDTTAALAAEHGLLSVTMSQIAERTGIGRATLYKYFPDVQTILIAWHERHIAGHLRHLGEVRDRAGTPARRVEAVLEAYAQISWGRAQPHHHDARHSADLNTFLHQDHRIAHPRKQVHDLIRTALADAAAAGDIRDDIAPGELATYCVHALDGAGSLPSKAAVRRLVTLTLTALRPPTTSAPGQG